MMHYRSFVALALFLLHSFGASLVSAQTDQIDNYIQFEMNEASDSGSGPSCHS